MIYLFNRNTHTASPNAFTYARIQILRSTALFLLSAAAGSVSPVLAWGAVAGPVWPGRAVAVALWWPPPSLEAGSGRHEPRGQPVLPDCRTPQASADSTRAFTALYVLQNSPSGEASFPWERARGGPSPPSAPRPPGSGISQGKPVRAFLAAIRQRVRAPQEAWGPSLQPFPLVLARSPPLPRHGFHWPLTGMPATVPRATPHG